MSQPSIQGEIEKALSKLAQANIQITGAGRTDAGVHARGQVVAFEMPQWRHESIQLQRAVNANLSDAIVLRDVEAVSAEFHPRFDARQRGYRYTIYHANEASPLNRHTSWHIRGNLDIAAMNEAAILLVGEHDFATFGTPPQGNNTVREVFRAQWVARDSYLLFDIVATAFLKRMVRSIVGSLRLVGSGKWTVDEFSSAFAARERSRSGAAAPPQGLVLEFVSYDDH